MRRDLCEIRDGEEKDDFAKGGDFGERKEDCGEKRGEVEEGSGKRRVIQEGR